MTSYYGDDMDLGERMEADQGMGGMCSGPVLGRRKWNSRKRFDCPTCKTKGALSAQQHARGYQCNACADRDEGRF